MLFLLFSAAGDRIRPILWSPEIKRPKTEPSLSSKSNNNLTLPALVSEPGKFKVKDSKGESPSLFIIDDMRSQNVSQPFNSVMLLYPLGHVLSE